MLNANLRLFNLSPSLAQSKDRVAGRGKNGPPTAGNSSPIQGRRDNDPNRILTVAEFAEAIGYGSSRGALAFVDGAIDFVPLIDFKPFEEIGMYDSSMYGLHYSQKIGALTRDTFAFFKIAKGWQAMSSWG